MAFFGVEADEVVVEWALQRFGEVVEDGGKGGAVHVRFATHEQAGACVRALEEEGRAADFVYNSTAYDCEGGEVYSGWCTFEQSVSKTSGAHLAAARRRAAARREPGEGPHVPPHMGSKVHGRAVPPHCNVATDGRRMRGTWPVP